MGRSTKSEVAASPEADRWKPESLPPTVDDEEISAKDGSYEPWISPKKQEFFLPLTGFGWFFHEEVEIINHPAFQRLGNVNQLGQAHYVYRGGNHKRIEHCLGVVSVAQKIISAIKKNADNAFRETKIPSAAHLNLAEERFVRLGALLHDIGHIVAGHTLEDELGIIGLHDEDERLSLIFGKETWPDYEFEEKACEPLEAKINRLYEAWVPDRLSECGLKPTDIVRLLVRKPPKTGLDKYANKLEQLKKTDLIRFDVCANIIGNTICADLLDYLYRDWYHVGRARSLNDRIFQYMEIRPAKGGPGNWHDKRSCEDVFVISLGRSPKIRTDGVSAILSLLEARYELAEAVLFHRTKLAAAAMLDRALFELLEGANPAYIVESLLHLSDHELLGFCVKEAKARLDKEKDDRYRISAMIINRLRGRRLYSGLFTLDYINIPDGDRDYIAEMFSGIGKNKLQAAQNRTSVARALEEDFGLTPGSLAVYCVQVKPKIAEVRIAVDDKVDQFDKLENEQGREGWLAGGHLSAQISRFARLMKVHFFIAREEKQKLHDDNKLEKLKQLRSFIKSIVVARGEELWESVKDKAAAQYFAEFYLKTDSVVFDPDGSAGDATYPNGAPRMSNFLRRIDGTRPLA